ncbi:leucyl aminopeptidase [Mycetocola zhadangensis]|uniref:Probable cytosol aminopeptidase n=1 Tax=Mycetocola zhadangensis TaxID=1164595 RepID=A0A3L7J6A7_9MICO|nr:leucyl aminopeptidase [Mycetocola zhadangensis]RLQ86054.1 leucyl aminopeptidase [Mycetocola zhadangensis]GGE87976.1 putative cytosol aminopeptidase [Mycetocola zhadangensis]
MPVFDLSVSSSPASDFATDVLVLGATANGNGPELLAPAGFDWLADSLKAIGATGAVDQLIRVPGNSTANSIAIIGIGSEVTPDALRIAAGSAIRQLAGAVHVALALPVRDAAELEAALEGAALGAYSFTAYKSTSLDSQKPPVANITVLADGALATSDEAQAAVSRARVVATAVAELKDLAATPANDLYPESLAAAAEASVRDLPVEVTVWNEESLRRDGFGGILGVGQGSSRGPRLVKLAYSPAGATRHIALVGKGITFDTGGLSLKPAASMLGMKDDMTGAATVLAVVRAAAELGLNVRVTAWLCIAENMPSGTAIRPGDVLRIANGTTVEVTNTDAEGRLVMADGLVAASAERPDAIIDVATLTGAQVVALGNRYTGVMGDEALVGHVLDAAKATGEFMWPMPFAEELRSLLRSDVADMVNAKVGNRAGGMLVAGLFLREFVGKVSDDDGAPSIPWAHLDIAGPGTNGESPYGFTGTGPTGVAVRTLLRVAEDFSRP